jgi:hypothetical protein
VVVTVESGATGETTFTAPAEPGSYPFVCSIPGHRESGMVGELIVTQAATSIGTALPAPAGAALLPPSSDTGSNALAALILAAGFVLAMIAFMTGMVRFVRHADDAR